MPQTVKQIKSRYFKKVFEQALVVDCRCGCGTKIRAKDKYGRDKAFISGHNGRKYDDPTQFKREWNHRNRKARLAYKKLYHRRRKVMCIELNGSECFDCGLGYNGSNAAIFHFHHLQAKSKKFAVGNQVVNLSWAKITDELRKCVMLCANCHELRHSGKF